MYERTPLMQEAEEYAKQEGFVFMETSAKTGEKVPELFVALGINSLNVSLPSSIRASPSSSFKWKRYQRGICWVSHPTATSHLLLHPRVAVAQGPKPSTTALLDTASKDPIGGSG